MCVCLSVQASVLPVEARKVESPLELELWAFVIRVLWVTETKLGSSEEQYILLVAEPLLQSQMLRAVWISKAHVCSPYQQ